MNSKETIVRNCIEAKRREANSYQNPGCYNAAFCRGYVEGASETLSTMLSPAENSTEAFVILSHYSNENIGEFNAVGLHGLYSSFDSAKKAADAMLKEDEENGCHGEAIPYTTAATTESLTTIRCMLPVCRKKTISMHFTTSTPSFPAIWSRK